MKSISKSFCIIIFIFLVNCCSCAKQNDFLTKQEIVQYGKNYTEWFYSSKFDSLILKILDNNYKISELSKFRQKVELQLGSQVKILNDQYGIEPWQNYYIQYSNFEKVDQPVKTLFTFNNKGKILQFTVQVLPKEIDSRFMNYNLKTNLILPFKEEWFVAWGGKNINENQHAVSKSQRFAYDFVIRKGVKTFKGSGKSNSDYYCYEKEVIAPAAGKVVEIINHVTENEIGKMPNIHGNRIVIDHGNNEYSILSHFKIGSIVVNEKSVVAQGQLLGLCGNSGHSSEPHIHYHLQNSPDIDNGEGLPIKFNSYFSNGKHKKNSSPKIGETVINF